MKNHIGIWVDLREALISKLTDKEQTLQKVESGLDIGHVKGGSGSSTPYGPQDAVSESKFLEKKKHAIKSYFDNIADAIQQEESILITGPAETKNALATDLEHRHDFRNSTIYCKTADSMTDNQFKALVRKHFVKKGEPGSKDPDLKEN